MAGTFEEYVTARSGTLLRFAYLLCGDAYLAEDLVQEVLITAHRRWRSLEASNPDSYLKQALVLKHLSWRRRRSASEVATASVAEVSGPSALAAFEDEHASREQVWALLATLPRAQRAVLVLRYFEDLDDRRIAELVGSSASTVRVHAHRGLHTLRATLARQAEEAPVGAEMLDNVAARTQRRRRVAAGVAVALAVVLVVVLVPTLRALLGSPRSAPPADPPTTSTGADALCPAEFHERVQAPQQPFAEGDLVPASGAIGATLCAYFPPTASGYSVSGWLSLLTEVGSPQALADHLNALPTLEEPSVDSSWACTDVGYEEYQILMRYPDRSVVVSTSRNCAAAWQGQVVRRLTDIDELKTFFGLPPDAMISSPAQCRDAFPPTEEVLAWAEGTVGEFRAFSTGIAGDPPLADAFPGAPDSTPGMWCGIRAGHDAIAWWAVVAGFEPGAITVTEGGHWRGHVGAVP